ncbi:hypothetical protein GCM10027592_58390 [Spirosoma flavus]
MKAGSAAVNSSDAGQSIAVNGTNLYVTGRFESTASIAGVTLNSNGGNDVFLAKYVDNGSSASGRWATSAGGGQGDIGNAVAVNGSNVYVGGQFYNAITLSGTTLNSSGTDDIDLFLAKYIDNGTTFANGWAVKGGASGSNKADILSSIDVNGADVFFTGGFTSGASIAGTTLTSPYTASFNVYVAKYTDNGGTATARWARGVSAASSISSGNAVAVNGTAVYVGGYFSGNVTIAGTALTANGSSNDAFLAYFTDNGSTATDGGALSGGSTNTDQGAAVSVIGNAVYLSGATRNGAVFGSNTVSSTGPSTVPFIAVAQGPSTGPIISNFASAPAPACAGSPVTFTATLGNVTGTYAYTLASSSGSPSSGTASSTNFSQNLTLTGSGSQTVTLSILANGQTASATTTVAQPSPIMSATAVTNVACNGGSNGVASVIASGGAGGYTYKWSTGSTLQTITGLMAGVYSYTITDANSCTFSRAVVVTQPSALVSSTAVTNLACNGGSNGVASVAGSGGAGGYSYKWSTGSSQQTITGLSAGVYSFTITDANSCNKTGTATISQPSAIVSTTAVTNVACNGGSNGMASVSVSGGAGGYTYSWSPSGGTNATATGLSAGSYTITVTDANNCYHYRTITVTEPPALAATTSVTAITCQGANNGRARVNVSGGAGGYSYSWSPSGGTGALATNLSPNSYTVSVSDANNCLLTRIVSLTQPAALAATLSQTNITCNGSASGGASVSVTGGTPDYTYSWAPSGGSGATATGLSAGSYTVTISDANGCPSITQTVSLTQPSALTLTGSQTNVTTYGGSDGVARVDVSGGVLSYNYTYHWGPGTLTGESTSSVSGLSAGVYSVTVTDANTCSKTQSFTLTQPAALTITGFGANPGTVCAGSPVTFTATIGNATEPYAYTLTTPGGSNVTGTASGTAFSQLLTASATGSQSFSLIVSANNQLRMATTSVLVNDLPMLTLNSSSVCAGELVSLSATSGLSSYTFTGASGPIAGSGNTRTIAGLPANTYSFTVTATNAQGCSNSATTAVTVNPLPNAQLTAAPSTTLTCTNTSLTLTATGGTSYSFTGPGIASQDATTGTAVVNASGSYSVLVTNTITGCRSATTITIEQNIALPTVSISPTNATLTCANPAVSLSAVGTGSYRWSTGATTATISVSTAATYSVTITGANGCSNTATSSVSADQTPPSLTVSPSTGTTLTCATPVVSLSAAGEGSLRWSTGETTPVISVSTANTYSVTLTGTNGCSSTGSVSVIQDQNPPSAAIAPTSATLTCTSPILSLSAMGTGTYRWSTGETTSIISASAAGPYSLTVTGTNGCSTSATTTLSLDTTPPPLSLSPISATLTCTTPVVSLSALGNGSLRWNTGATTASISATSAGTYSVTLTGSNGCSSTASSSVAVDQTPPALLILPASATVTCTNPVVSLSAIGTGSYRWSTGATTSAISVSTATTYSVTLTGANGCSSTTAASVSADQLAPSVSINPAIGTPASTTLTCSTPVVSLTAVGSGSYRWSTGATTASISVSVAGPYSVTLTGANGCSSSASVSVSADQTPPSLSITPSSATLTCASPVVSLSAVGNGTYRWSTGATTASLSVSVAATYSVTLTGANGCTTVATVIVSEDKTPPLVSISPASATLTCTTPVVSLSALGSGTYRWNTGATTASISVSAAGPYSVTLTGANGCTATTSAAVIYQNCGPTVANIIPSQSATVGSAYSYTIPATTFTDAETPNSLTLSVSGLPAGLSFVSPNTITGTPSTTVGSPFTVTVVATDPGGLSVATTFTLTVQPRSFAITGVTMLDCNHISYFERRINFTVSFEGTNGQPISLSVVNEATAVAINEPYQLNLFTDNPVIVFKARQQGTPGEASFSYNWLAFCANGNPRVENAIPPQSATVGQAFSYTIPANTFTDAETPNSLSLSVVGLPAGLSFVAPATIAGTVSASASAFYSVTVIATDPAGGSISTILPLSVVNSGGCGSMFTLKVGDWNDPATWSCGRIPVLTDAVTLNHAVSLPPTYQALALRVIYSTTGRLLFGASSRLKLGGN